MLGVPSFFLCFFRLFRKSGHFLRTNYIINGARPCWNDWTLPLFQKSESSVGIVTLKIGHGRGRWRMGRWGRKHEQIPGDESLRFRLLRIRLTCWAGCPLATLGGKGVKGKERHGKRRQPSNQAAPTLKCWLLLDPSKLVWIYFTLT